MSFLLKIFYFLSFLREPLCTKNVCNGDVRISFSLIADFVKSKDKSKYVTNYYVPLYGFI